MVHAKLHPNIYQAIRRRSRWSPWQRIWFSDRNDFSLCFINYLPRCSRPSVIVTDIAFHTRWSTWISYLNDFSFDLLIGRYLRPGFINIDQMVSEDMSCEANCWQILALDYPPIPIYIQEHKLTRVLSGSGSFTWGNYTMLQPPLIWSGFRKHKSKIVACLEQAPSSSFSIGGLLGRMVTVCRYTVSIIILNSNTMIYQCQ